MAQIGINTWGKLDIIIKNEINRRQLFGFDDVADTVSGGIDTVSGGIDSVSGGVGFFGGKLSGVSVDLS